MAQDALPSHMRALVTQEKGRAVVTEIPVPSIDDDEILVRTVAIAQNPTDWKYIDNVGKSGTICGCDWSGNVVSVGKSVTTFAVGDHVAGFTQGGTYTDRGAFAEYLKVPADLAWKVPEGTLTYEQAATLGCGFWTSVQALFHPTRLGLTEPPERTTTEEWVLVYGASSSVGLFAVQLAHIAGYRVLGLASPKNFGLAKSLGATAMVDYKDPEAAQKIKEITNDTVHIGFDTISELETQSLALSAFGPGKGKLVTTLGSKEGAQKLRDDVRIQPTLIYTALGRAFTLGGYYPESPDDRAHMASFLKKLRGIVSTGLIKPNPVKLWDGGLDAINEGLQHMREGKVSGEKIVYRI